MNRFRLLLFFPVVFVLTSGIVPAHEVASPENGTGTITGQLLIRGGGPMSDGLAFFFAEAQGPPPSRDLYWRIPDYIIPIGSEGRFSAELPAGTYYFGAIKRAKGDKMGPPREGDYIYIDMNDNGAPKAHLVNRDARMDIGVLSGAIPFNSATVKLKDGITGIEGLILDAAGKPVPGVFVYAALNPAVNGKPIFVSDRTGNDGKYLLRVHEGGRFYLKVRDIYGGGPPGKGAVTQSSAGESLVAVTVKRGDILKGIDIHVTPFPGRGPEHE